MEPFTRNGSIIGSAMDLAATDQYILSSSTTRIRPTLVGSQTYSRAGSTTAVNVVFSLTGGTNTTPQAGDIVILAIALGAAATTLMTTPSGYTTLAHFASSDTYDSVLYVGYKIMGSTPDTTFPVPNSITTSNSQMVTVFVWRNFNPTNPIDVTTQTATGANSRLADPPPITPVTENSVIMGIGACAYSGTVYSFSAGGNLTGFITTSGSDTYDGALGTGYYNWTSGTFDPTAFSITGSTTSDSWTAVSLAIRSKEVTDIVYGNKKNSGIWDVPAIYTSKAVRPSFPVEYLVIAGGGGGGLSGNDSGGGGAGGYRSSVVGESSGGGATAEQFLLLNTGTNYSVSIGAGGAAGANGGNSTFYTITSIGGGRGCNVTTGAVAGTGGSGGGGAATGSATGAAGTANQGYAGGNYATDAGGGGGAGGPGRSGNEAAAQGYGGIGVTSSITGTAVARAGGGGGGVDTTAYGVAVAGGGSGKTTAPGENGTVNTGGGGGGTGAAGSGGSGGSGVVILKYPSYLSITFGTGLTGSESVVGLNKVAIITSGSGNVSWS